MAPRTTTKPAADRYSEEVVPQAEYDPADPLGEAGPEIIGLGDEFDLDDILSNDEDVVEATATYKGYTFEFSYDMTRISPDMIEGLRDIQFERALSRKRKNKAHGRAKERDDVLGLETTAKASKFYKDVVASILVEWPLVRGSRKIGFSHEETGSLSTLLLAEVVQAALSPGKE